MSQPQINYFVNLLNSGSPYSIITYINKQTPILKDVMFRSLTPQTRNVISHIKNIAETLHNNPSKSFVLNVYRNVNQEARAFYDQFLSPNVKFFKDTILKLDEADDYEVLMRRWSRLPADWKEEAWDYTTKQTRDKLRHIFMREGLIPPLPSQEEQKEQPIIQPRPSTPRNIITISPSQPIMEEKTNE